MSKTRKTNSGNVVVLTIHERKNDTVAISIKGKECVADEERSMFASMSYILEALVDSWVEKSGANVEEMNAIRTNRLKRKCVVKLHRGKTFKEAKLQLLTGEVDLRKRTNFDSVSMLMTNFMSSKAHEVGVEVEATAPWLNTVMHQPKK